MRPSEPVRQRRWWWLSAIFASSALAFYVSAPSGVPASVGDGAAGLDQYLASIDTVGTNRFIAVWSDERRSGYVADLWGTAVDSVGGTVVPVTRNVQLTSDRRGARQASVACGPGTCLVVWQEDALILGERIDSNLDVLDAAPLIIESCSNDCFNPAAAWDGQSWLAAYTNDHVKTRRVPQSGPLVAAADDLGTAQYATFARVATDSTTTLVAFVNAAGQLTWATYAAGAATRQSGTLPTVTSANPITYLNIGGVAGFGFFAAWREQTPLGDTLEGAYLGLSGGSATLPVTIINRTEGNTLPPIVLKGGNAIVTYWNSNDGHEYDGYVNLATLGLGPPKDLSLPSYGYAGALSSAMLPTGEQVLANSVVRVGGDVELVAVDATTHLLDAGPASAAAQVDARAAWAIDHFVLVTFEEAGPHRHAFVHSVSPLGVVTASAPLTVTDDATFAPVLSSDGDAGLALGWVNYGELVLSHLDGALTQGPLQRAGPPGTTGFYDFGLTNAGGHPFAATNMSTGNTCLIDAPSATAAPASWRFACAPLDVFDIASTASTTNQWVAYTLRTGELYLVGLPLLPAALDAGTLQTGAIKVVGSASAFPHVPAMASDGTNVLLVWWQKDTNVETVGAVLVDPTGAFTTLPDLSSRVIASSSNRGHEKPVVVYDGRRYEVAYSAPGTDGGWDAFVRPVDPDGTLEPEQIVAVTGVDQRVEDLSPSTPGRVLAVTRAYDADAGAMRMSLRVLAAVEPGDPCFAPNECISGSCTGGVCPLPASDGGMDAGQTLDGGVVTDGGTPPDAGMLRDAGGPPVDAGPEVLPDGGSGPRQLGAGCACGSSETPLLALFAAVALRRRRPGYVSPGKMP